MVKNVNDGLRYMKSRNPEGMFRVNSFFKGGQSKAALSCQSSITYTASWSCTSHVPPAGSGLNEGQPRGAAKTARRAQRASSKGNKPKPHFSKHFVWKPHNKHASAGNIFTQ